MNYKHVFIAGGLVIAGAFVYGWLQVHSVRVIDWRSCYEAKSHKYEGEYIINCLGKR